MRPLGVLDTYWVPQKLPQIYTIIVYICIGKVEWFSVYIGGNKWNNLLQFLANYPTLLTWRFQFDRQARARDWNCSEVDACLIHDNIRFINKIKVLRTKHILPSKFTLLMFKVYFFLQRTHCLYKRRNSVRKVEENLEGKWDSNRNT